MNGKLHRCAVTRECGVVGRNNIDLQNGNAPLGLVGDVDGQGKKMQYLLIFWAFFAIFFVFFPTFFSFFLHFFLFWDLCFSHSQTVDNGNNEQSTQGKCNNAHFQQSRTNRVFFTSIPDVFFLHFCSKDINFSKVEVSSRLEMIRDFQNKKKTLNNIKTRHRNQLLPSKKIQKNPFCKACL